MYAQDSHGARREAQLVVRAEITRAVLRTLEGDRMGADDQTIGPERDATIDRLTTAIRDGAPIDLAAPRSSAAADYDRQSPTTAGYLLGLIRDHFAAGFADWSQFAALGALAVDIEAAVTTIRVPAPFAQALLEDLRKPECDGERESITDPDQLEYEGEIDACVRQWLRELDAEGDRILIVQNGPGRAWLDDYLHGAMLEGLTGRLDDGPVERTAAIDALAGWADVVGQLDPKGSDE